MPRWVWFLPLGTATVLLGLWGFRLGWIAVTITETDVINRFAARYLAEAGPEARATDCAARPGQRRGVWLVVICQGPARFEYPVDRFGRLLPTAPPATGGLVPEV